jgi:probable rRNA maturation factor
MIEFFSETDFSLDNPESFSIWINSVLKSEGYTEGDITYVFCDDEYLHKINLEYLNHDTLTDIISFDYSIGKQIHGEIYISIERIKENAFEFNEPFDNELKRVIIHGILHFMGYKDKTPKEEKIMRNKENEAIATFPTI